jgi:hypothetical protein
MSYARAIAAFDNFGFAGKNGPSRMRDGGDQIMANNRMWLVNKTTGKRVLLCKYYPTSGWYLFHSQEHIDAYLAAVRLLIDEERTIDDMYGPTDFILEFDHHEQDNK